MMRRRKRDDVLNVRAYGERDRELIRRVVARAEAGRRTVSAEVLYEIERYEEQKEKEK